MGIEETLTWPFFDEDHRAFAAALARWADATLPALPHGEHRDAVDAACRSRVKALGEAGFLKAVVGAEHGGLHSRLTCAPFVWRGNPRVPATAWRISPSRCKAWAPAPFRSSARPR